MTQSNLIVLFLAVLAVVGLLWPRGDAGARSAAEAGARLIDVRSRSEFDEGHLPGARNVPLHELTDRLDEFGSRSEPLVIYCRSGARSSAAKQKLRILGFERVYDLGAMRNW